MSIDLLDKNRTLSRLKELGPELRARGVAHLDLFGSVARGEAADGSDIDLLVELSRPLGFEFFRIEALLSDALGVPVELSTRAGMRPRVLEQAERDLVRVF